MTNLNDTYAGKEILRRLEKKFGTRDPELLLGIVLMENGVLEKIFTPEEQVEMYRRTILYWRRDPALLGHRLQGRAGSERGD